MRIAEIFHSLQGEGKHVGTPSVFVRVSGCNLRCAWCDTPYTSWNPEGGRRAVRDLLAAAHEASLRHVVVTGGEPLLQRELGELTRGLAANGHHITVETAGTLAPAFECHLLSLSPKTSNSDPEGRFRGRHRALRSAIEPLQSLLARHPEHQLKFVAQGKDDVAEILALVGRLGVERERVLLMPEGRSAAEVGARAPVVARLCLEHGFRYSPRLHLELFGNIRGV
jgi:7-carboxy-7-deazaguanine synthase